MKSANFYKTAVFDTTVLRFYPNNIAFCLRFDKEPNGLIVLENCFVQLVDGDEFQSTFSINFFGGKSKVYTFAAEDDEKCTDWVKALSTSSYR